MYTKESLSFIDTHTEMQMKRKDVLDLFQNDMGWGWLRRHRTGHGLWSRDWVVMALHYTNVFTLVNV